MNSRSHSDIVGVKRILKFLNLGKCWIIDVSQSVEHDHPYALDFLRFDCRNVNLFFQKQNVAVPSVRQLFEFVVETSITEQNIGKKKK